ncbi:hypothetical protein D9619_003526 [Psilocybe cf. subviscida]|uniref:Uncharacterized protein n=1 Tax=Psilocybe cf. subviscida TaxID=2480587 RepID=A0A8H5EUV2_9AGAR|nr:hypothetical protein D9619_003526 [Psilocybe cf. subviscida]
MMSLTPDASVPALLETSQVVSAITDKDLDVQAIVNSVQDDGAGATAVFIGTTRNSFKGKVVTKLEYQAYSKLAVKTMSNVAHASMKSAVRSEHQPSQTSSVTTTVGASAATSIIKCAVWHRIGTVPVGQPSIVIAVSSPHRKEAFLVCEEILEQVKAKAQIWKREYYEGEDDATAEWKANA